MNSAGPCLLLLLLSLLLLLASSMSAPPNGAKLGRRKRETTADKENNSVTTHRVDTSIRIETVVEKRMAEESGKHEDHSGSSSSDESESGAAGRDEDYAAFARDHGYPLPEAPVPEVEYSLPALQPEGTHAKDGTHAAVKHNHNQITQLGKDYGGLKVNHDIHTNRLDMLDDNLHVREHEHSGLAAQQLANEVKNGELSFNQFMGIKRLEKSTKTMDQTQRTMDTDLEMLGKSRDEFMSKTNQALSNNEATIGQNSSRLGKAESGLKGEMEQLTADGQRIDGIQSELNTMDGMVTTHENKIKEHGTVLGTAKEDIKGLQKVQAEHTEGINQLGQKQSDFEETNQKRQAEHMQNLATVHSQVTGLDSALATNQLALKNQGIQLGKLETGLTAEETARKEGHATHMGLIQGQADLSRVHEGRIKGQAQQHGQLVNGLKKANQKHGELAADFDNDKSSNQGIFDAQGKLIEENGRAIGGVQTVVAGHGPRLTAAESDITTLGTGLKGAKADVQRHEGDIERHRQDLETKKDKLTSVDTTLLNHDNSIERLDEADKARVKDIEKVNSHIGEVHTGLVGEIAATDGQVAQNTIGIQKNRESLERQDRDLADTNVILTDQGGQLSDHDSKYKDHVSLMQQIEERFDQNDTKVKDLLVNQHEIDNALVQSGMALGDNVLKGEQQVLAANKAALKEVQDAIAAMKEKMDFIKQKQAAQDQLLKGHIGTTQTSSTKTKTTIEENNMFESGAAA